MNSNFNISGIGSILITDAETGEIIAQTKNAINPRNMALILARGLSNETNGQIAMLAFGNGGTFLSSTSTRVFRQPNVIGSGAQLYNQTYAVSVDESLSSTPLTNSVRSALSPAPALSAITVISCTLSAAEPSNQAASDNLSTATSTQYTFDEMGIISADGLLLSHAIFSPIEKAANRSFALTYTLTISVS